MISPQIPGSPKSGRDSGHGGQDPESGREEHLPHPSYGSRLDARSPGGDVALHVFSDDDGVVHHDPQGQDEPEQADHVHRHPESGHHQERAEERYRESGGGPDRQPARKREEQDQEDERQSLEAVSDERVHAALEELPGIEPGADGEPGRQRGIEFADLRVDRSRGLEEARPGGQRHFQEHGRLPVHARGALHVREPVGDRRHVSDGHDTASRSGDQGNPGEILRAAGFGFGAQP